MINFPMEFENSKNSFGIMKGRELWTVNKNSGIVKFCGLSGHAKCVQKSKIYIFLQYSNLQTDSTQITVFFVWIKICYIRESIPNIHMLTLLFRR